MGNMVTAAVAIEGTRTILWHHFGPEALPLEKGERTGVAGHDPEEWRRTVLMTAERQLFLEPTYIFASLRDGAKYTRKGRGSIQTAVAATVQVVEDRVLVDRFVPEEPIPTDASAVVYLDIRGVRNPATRAMNVRYRIGASPGWKAQFTLLWDKTIVSRGEMEAVVRDAGKLSGIADGRVIGYGRYKIAAFDVTDG
jgi:hypothetical protein